MPTAEIKKAQSLKKSVQAKNNSNEHKVMVNGVSCSRAVLESIILYCETFIRNCGYGFSPYMEPMGEVREVLEKNGITSGSRGW